MRADGKVSFEGGRDRRTHGAPGWWALVACLVLMMAGIRVQGADSAGYAVQPGDLLQVSVWKEEDLQLEVLVRPDGGFSIPLAGDIAATGRTVEELRVLIAKRLTRFIPDAVVNVALLEIRGNTIYVLGKVTKPGAFVMVRETDVMQALSMAGGTTPFASLGKIKVLRRVDGRLQSIAFNYAEVEAGVNLDQNVVLHSGDIVVVP